MRLHSSERDENRDLRVDLDTIAGDPKPPSPSLSRLAELNLPVVLCAPEGANVLRVAEMIHRRGPRAGCPLTVLPCPPLCETGAVPRLLEATLEAKGGALVLDRLDLADQACGDLLAPHIVQLIGSWCAPDRSPTNPRLIVTSASPVSELPVPKGVQRELEPFTIVLAPFNAIQGAVERTVREIISAIGGDPDDLDPSIYEILQTHEWDGDERALARTVAIMASMTSHADLNAHHARAAMRLVFGKHPEEPTPRGDPESREARDLAAEVLDGTFAATYHPGLLAGFRWLSENFTEDISTEDFAIACDLSISHVSHLVKEQSGDTFRILLARIRIEHARRLLKADIGRQITEIAYDVGFRDLSHFIKSFGRFTGMSPREYRRHEMPTSDHTSA